MNFKMVFNKNRNELHCMAMWISGESQFFNLATWNDGKWTISFNTIEELEKFFNELVTDKDKPDNLELKYIYFEPVEDKNEL